MSARKQSLITGFTGKDDFYLAKLPLEKVYEVHGFKRRSFLFNTKCVDNSLPTPHSSDLIRLVWGIKQMVPTPFSENCVIANGEQISTHEVMPLSCNSTGMKIHFKVPAKS